MSELTDWRGLPFLSAIRFTDRGIDEGWMKRFLRNRGAQPGVLRFTGLSEGD
jgi:hypothetical protein